MRNIVYQRLVVTAASLIATLGAGVAAQAQTMLAPGDIAFTGFSAANPDNFGLVLLRSIAANTTFTITDNAYNADGTRATDESSLNFTAPSALSAGTVLLFTNLATDNSPGFSGNAFTGTNAGFSSNGDNLFLFQGDILAPSFIAGFSGQSYITTGVPSSSTTFLPSALTLGSSALTFNSPATTNVNGVYNGPTVGTAGTLRSALFNPANFTTGATNIPTTSFPQSFTVAAAVPEPATLALAITGVLPLAGLVLRRRRN